MLSLFIDRQVYVGGDVVVHEGAPASGMYFIVAGRAWVYKRDFGAAPIKELCSNGGIHSVFGEMALLARPEGRAVATVTVPPHAYCDTFLLVKSRFREVTACFPSFRKRIERVMAEREQENHERALDKQRRRTCEIARKLSSDEITCVPPPAAGGGG